MKQRKPLNLLVPKAGLEPARPLRRGILNPSQLIVFIHDIYADLASLCEKYGEISNIKCLQVKNNLRPQAKMNLGQLRKWWLQ